MADMNNKKAAKKTIYESQESLYNKALNKMKEDSLIVQYAYKIENYMAAASMFDEVGEYLDASELAEQCRKLAEQAKQDEKAHLYQMAIKQKEEARTWKEFEKAEKLFRELSGYKDAKKERDLCLRAIKELQKKSRRKRNIILCILAVIVIAAAAFIMSPGWEQAQNLFLKKTEPETEAPKLKDLEPGDKVSFGKYTWYILKKEGTKATLIMSGAEKFEELRHTPYHEKQEAVTWETSSLREWLNSDFLTENFTEEEQEKILTVDVKNAANSVYGTSGGSDTQDRVYILSAEEVEEYSDILSYIRMNIWLRTPGNSPDTTSFMASTTAVMSYGYPVTSTNFYTCPVICVSIE